MGLWEQQQIIKTVIWIEQKSILKISNSVSRSSLEVMSEIFFLCLIIGTYTYVGVWEQSTLRTLLCIYIGLKDTDERCKNVRCLTEMRFYRNNISIKKHKISI